MQEVLSSARKKSIEFDYWNLFRLGKLGDQTQLSSSRNGMGPFFYFQLGVNVVGVALDRVERQI